jgi:hypothetical protein
VGAAGGVSPEEEEERELRMEHMRVDLELKRQQVNWEPWKAMAAAFGTGAAFTGAMVAIIAAFMRHA